ncbi:MAG: thioredoxin family protein [Armatimonadota bacterium]
MKSNCIKLLVLVSLIAAIGVSAPVQSAPKPAPKVKTGAVAPKKALAKSAKKPAAKKIAKQLPRLLDLGATKCILCKMMVPVLDDLRKEYKGQLDVRFIDIWKDQSASSKYKVQTIPTQIFFDAKGKEFSRHVGFFPKEDIIKTFDKHGIKLKKSVQSKKPEKK